MLLRVFKLINMGKHIRYSGVRFTSQNCGWRFSDCSESSVEDILDSLNDDIEDVLQNALPRVSMFSHSTLFHFNARFCNDISDVATFL